MTFIRHLSEEPDDYPGDEAVELEEALAYRESIVYPSEIRLTDPMMRNGEHTTDQNGNVRWRDGLEAIERLHDADYI